MNARKQPAAQNPCSIMLRVVLSSRTVGGGAGLTTFQRPPNGFAALSGEPLLAYCLTPSKICPFAFSLETEAAGGGAGDAGRYTRVSGPLHSSPPTVRRAYNRWAAPINHIHNF